MGGAGHAGAGPCQAAVLAPGTAPTVLSSAVHTRRPEVGGLGDVVVMGGGPCDAGMMLMMEDMMGAGVVVGDPAQGGMLVMDAGDLGPGMQIVAGGAAAGPRSDLLEMDDLPFSSVGLKNIWLGIVGMMKADLDSHTRAGAAFPGRRLPLPNIPDRQIELLFEAYDADGIEAMPLGKLKALMRDMQCVEVLAMSQDKDAALREANSELTMQMGPQLAQMMSGAVSQGMDMSLMMAKQQALQEPSDEEATELLRMLDADGDGVLTKRDFCATAKKVLFDPNPPEEIMQVMEMMEAAMSGMPMMIGAAPPQLAIAGPMGGMPAMGAVPMASPVCGLGHAVPVPAVSRACPQPGAPQFGASQVITSGVPPGAVAAPPYGVARPTSTIGGAYSGMGASYHAGPAQPARPAAVAPQYMPAMAPAAYVRR